MSDGFDPDSPLRAGDAEAVEAKLRAIVRAGWDYPLMWMETAHVAEVIGKLNAEVARLRAENETFAAIVDAATAPDLLRYLRNLADHQSKIRGRIREAEKDGKRPRDEELDRFLGGEIEILRGFLSAVDATAEKKEGQAS